MKKMLDELKKLDVEYEVPQDFRKKVMDKIKAESTKEMPNKNKVIHLRKYVIACASIAAIVVVFVNVKNLPKKNFDLSEASITSDVNSIQSFNRSPNSVTSAASTDSASEATTGEIEDITNRTLFNDFAKKDADSQANAVEKENASEKKMILKVKDIKDELKRIGVSYEIIENEIFIQKADLQIVKDTIDKEILDGLEFIEKNDKIQIYIK